MKRHRWGYSYKTYVNLATDGDIRSLANYLSNITLANLPSVLATDGDIPSLVNYLSSVTDGDLPNNVATYVNIPTIPSNLATDGDIPSLPLNYLDRVSHLRICQTMLRLTEILPSLANYLSDITLADLPNNVELTDGDIPSLAKLLDQT